jgi:RNA polymerase sigma-70 factor (ECF subfamily)
MLKAKDQTDLLKTNSLISVCNIFMKKDTSKDLASKKSAITTAALANGSIEALSQLYLTYFNRLLSFGLQIHEDKGLVEDCIQELFIWIKQNPSKIKRIEYLEVYLFQAVKKNIHSKLQKQSLAAWRSVRFVTLQQQIEEDAEQLLIKEESRLSDVALVKFALERLPHYQRQVIYLRYYEGLNFEEIAAILNINNQVARNYSSQGMKTIRTYLAEAKK